MRWSMTISARQARLAGAAACLAALIAAVLVVAVRSHDAGAASGQPQVPAALLASSVRDAQRLSESAGWALVGAKLEITADAGKSWTDITPPNIGLDTIRAVSFADVSHGWILTTETTDSTSAGLLGQLVVYRTADGGQTWQSAPIGDPTPANADDPAGAASFDFLTDETGWLSVTLPTSGAFSQGLLFATSDGGSTWTQRTIPIGAPVAFATPSDGWTAGGVGGGSLYVTHDGGSNWKPFTLSVPSAQTSANVLYGLPAPAAGPADAISATFDAGKVVWFTTSDNGESFVPGSAQSTGQTFDGGAGVVSGQANGTVVSVFPAAGRTVWGSSKGASAVSASVGLPVLPSAAASRVSVISSAGAWAVIAGEACASKANCSSYSGLFSTDDSGSHWTQLFP